MHEPVPRQARQVTSPVSGFTSGFEGCGLIFLLLPVPLHTRQRPEPLHVEHAAMGLLLRSMVCGTVPPRERRSLAKQVSEKRLWIRRETACPWPRETGSPALSMTARARWGPMAHTGIDGLRLG